MNLIRAALVAQALTAAPLLLGPAASAHAQVMVGGAPMYASKDIMDNAVDSKGRTILVAAEGEGLTATVIGGIVTDSKGGMAHVTTADVIHVMDRVLLPS